MTKYKDTIVGAVAIGISIALFIATFSIKEFTRTSLGADFVPRLTALVFAALGGILIFREFRKNRELAALPPCPPVQKEAAKMVGLHGAPPSS